MWSPLASVATAALLALTQVAPAQALTSQDLEACVNTVTFDGINSPYDREMPPGIPFLPVAPCSSYIPVSERVLHVAQVPSDDLARCSAV